jgi:DNA polymerase III delta prime subunit
MGPGGMDALITLGAGDMRRSLNILQSCHMAFDEVDGDAVYLCTGNPMPRDIEAVVNWLLNEEFNEAFEREWRLSRWRAGGGGGSSLLYQKSCRRLAGGSSHTPRPVATPPPAGILQLQVEKGVALVDVVREIHP